MFENVDNPEDSSVKSQVEEIKAKIGVECPIFVKAMQPSNVASGFLLALPKQFCHSHLPSHDATIILQDESGEKYRTKFIVQKDKSILSSGWRRFCFANKLVVGDVLVFHLVRPLKFKVYIMGTHSLAEVEEAFSLLKFGSCTKQTAFEEIRPMPLPKDVCQVHIGEKTSLTLDSNAALIDEEYNEEFGFNILEDVGLSIPATDFGDVENTKDFTILVNGVSINSCLSEEIRNRYYDLCCSQRSFLHNHLLKSINGKLAAEIITETINIANAIRACRLSTPHGAYVLWEKTLDAFEILGMNVGFLHARLKQLLSLSFRTKQALIRKSKEAKLEQARAKDKVITLESKYWKLMEREDGKC
ncbi:putative transcription factor B3-Domain family [Rosa chinensis]|uniref:Putative transcription factor B3-Domain family n=2 Tax=Rosa chinensis TaxID=74649 RepID=A0A2P6PML4_ROSCH|nr:putative transcription factor B3-Domain family [Rosa chinensis]